MIGKTRFVGPTFEKLEEEGIIDDLADSDSNSDAKAKSGNKKKEVHSPDSDKFYDDWYDEEAERKQKEDEQKKS